MLQWWRCATILIKAGYESCWSDGGLESWYRLDQKPGTHRQFGHRGNSPRIAGRAHYLLIWTFYLVGPWAGKAEGSRCLCPLGVVTLWVLLVTPGCGTPLCEWNTWSQHQMMLSLLYCTFFKPVKQFLLNRPQGPASALFGTATLLFFSHCMSLFTFVCDFPQIKSSGLPWCLGGEGKTVKSFGSVMLNTWCSKIR